MAATVKPSTSKQALKVVDRDDESLGLRLDGVTKTFGRRMVLDRVSLDVEPGQVVGLVGANGAGKTTLLGLSSGLSTPSSGLVSRRGRLAMLPEHISFIEHLNGRQNLELLGRLRAHPTMNETRVLLEGVGLDPSSKTRVARYSQGMRQRLGVAQVLMERADLVILDEPVNGLDPDGIRWLRSVIRGEADRGAAVLVSSHLLDELEKVCDRVVKLEGGRLSLAWTSGPKAAVQRLRARVEQADVLAQACEALGWKVSAGAHGEHVIDTDRPSGPAIRALALAGVDFVHVGASGQSLEDAVRGARR